MTTTDTLNGLAGLNAAKAVISRLAEKPSGIHAVLLYGPAGAGKSALVDLLVEAWLRRVPEPEEDKAVTAYRRFNSADVLKISPEGPQNLIKGNTIVNDKPNADDPVPLREFFRTMPLVGEHKIAVISQCERMNPTSSNALLKTLEEPHPHAKLILTSDSIGQVPATVRSRCLCVACELPAVNELHKMFAGLSDDELRLSEGAPGRIHRLRDASSEMGQLARFAKGLRTRKVGEALVVSEEFRAICDLFEKRESANVRSTHAYVLELLANYLVGEADVDPRWVQAIVEAHRRIIFNGNAGVVFDALFASLLV